MNVLQLRHANRTAFAVSVLAFLLLCMAIVHWGTLLLAPRSPIAPVEVVADPRASVDVRAAAALFGVGGVRGPAAATVTDIQVLGLAASRTRAVAILVLDGKPPKAYGEGDAISRGIRLVQVADDAITIERDGVRQRLDVPARASLSVLTSGASRARDTSLIAPVSVSPGAAPLSPAPTSPGASSSNGAPTVAPIAPSGPPANASPLPGPGSMPGMMNPHGGVGANIPPPPPQASMPPGPTMGQPNPLDRGMPEPGAAPNAQ